MPPLARSPTTRFYQHLSKALLPANRCGATRRERAKAEFEKRLACVIRADGTIARGHMIDS
jgi:hypothetical protein